MSQTFGRRISVSEAINNILADYFKIDRASLPKFRQRRTGTNIATRQVPVDVEIILNEFKAATPDQRKSLLEDPDKGAIIEALYTEIIGKEL